MKKLFFSAVMMMAFVGSSFGKTGEVKNELKTSEAGRDCYSEGTGLRDQCLAAGTSQATADVAGLEAMSACLEETLPVTRSVTSN